MSHKGAHSDRIHDKRVRTTQFTTTEAKKSEPRDPLALERYACPITYNPATSSFGRPIAQTTCQNKCRNRDTNKKCTEIRCGSPWRLCRVCLSQPGFDTRDAVVVDPEEGLCAFHSARGESARKPLPSDIRKRFAGPTSPPVSKKEPPPVAIKEPIITKRAPPIA